jgi:iron complex transport system ATP-binding protein
VIELDDVGVSLGGRSIVENVSFEVSEGSLVGLVGPNGAGKTTVVKTINGLLAPDEGEVRIDGDPVTRLPAREVSRRVATVPQDTSLGFDFPVREVVAMGRTPHRTRFERESAADREAVEEALERTQITEFADRSIDAVSGGERQRVILARALCQRSSHLLLDEPTASLDIGHGVRILRLARELASEGRTALAAIHKLDLAARFCDELVLLAEGEVLATGSPEAVLTETNLEAAFDVEVRVTSHPVTGSVSVTALPDRPSRDERIHVLGGGQAGAAAITRCRRAGFRATAGPLPEGDVALARARALGVETSATEPFAPISSAARQKSARMIRNADVAVLAENRKAYRELAAVSDRTIVLGGSGADEKNGANERPRAIGATTAGSAADSVIEGDVALDTPGENEGQEDRGSERVRVGSDDTLLEAIEHVLDERDGNEH